MSKCRKPIEYVKYWLRYDHLNKYIPHRNSVLYALAPNRARAYNTEFQYRTYIHSDGHISANT